MYLRQSDLLYFDLSQRHWLVNGRMKAYLVHLLDPGSNLVYARFVPDKSAARSVEVLGEYFERFGCPAAIQSKRVANLVRGLIKNRRKSNPRTSASPDHLEIAFHEPPQTDRPKLRGILVRHIARRLTIGLTAAGVESLEEANRFLSDVFLPAYNSQMGQARSHAKPRRQRGLRTKREPALSM